MKILALTIQFVFLNKKLVLTDRAKDVHRSNLSNYLVSPHQNIDLLFTDICCLLLSVASIIRVSKTVARSDILIDNGASDISEIVIL